MTQKNLNAAVAEDATDLHFVPPFPRSSRPRTQT
jgi:hypothetical protein